MKKWLRRIRAAARMGLTWAAGWAPVGLLIGLVMGGNSRTPDGFPVDDWVMPLVALGFLGGAIFSGVLRIAEGRRRFDELSLPRFGAWGALGGLVLGVLAVAAWQLDAGFGPVLWLRATVIIGSATLLSAVSASGSLALARRAGGARTALETRRSANREYKPRVNDPKNREKPTRPGEFAREAERGREAPQLHPQPPDP